MGFSLKKAIKLRFDPKTAAEMKLELLKPSEKPTLDNLFKKLDPFLDTIDPMHDAVQKWTTGQSTTEGQSPYFQKIAPTIVNFFFPGAGSAVAAVSAGFEGDTKGAITNAAGATVGYFGTGGSVMGVSGQTVGRVASIAGTAYALNQMNNTAGYGFFTASGDLIATPNSESAMSTPIYESGSYSNPYALAAHFNSPGTNEAANAAIIDAQAKAQQNQSLMIGAALLLLYFFARKG